MSAAWARASFGDLTRLERRSVDVIADRQYQEIGTYSYGRGIFHKQPRSGLEVGSKDLFLMKEGDLILQVTFAWEGAIALCSKAEDGLYGSVRYPTFRVNEDRCFAPFLAKYLCTWEGLDQIRRICPGSAGRNRVLAIKRLPEITIPLPPLDEQRRIVARIEELVKKVEEAKSLREQASQTSPLVIDAFLRECFSQLAKSHAPESLDKLLNNATYGTSEKSHAERSVDAIPVLRIPNVVLEKLQLSDMKYSRLNRAAIESLTLKDGDILIVRTNGSLDLVGRCAVVRELPEPSVYASYLIRLRFEKTRIIPEFAQIGLRHLRRSGALFDLARTTAGQYNISLGRLRKAALPIPPLETQRRIIAELDGLQSKLNSVNALQVETAEELDATIPAILDKAFKGEL